MGVRIRWCAVLASLLVLIVASPSLAAAAPPAPGVFVDDPAPAPGAPFGISITGCSPGETVTVQFAGATSSVVTNFDGEAQLELTAPTEAGEHTGGVTCRGATTNFTVTVPAPLPPSVTIDDPAVDPGAPFDITITGCLPGELVEVAFEGSEAQIAADATGAVSGALGAPTDPGSYSGSVICNGGLTTNFTVTVLAPATTETTEPPPEPTPATDPPPPETTEPAPAPAGTSTTTAPTTTSTTLVAPTTVSDESGHSAATALVIVGIAIGFGGLVVAIWAFARGRQQPTGA